MRFILGFLCICLIIAPSILADADVSEIRLDWQNGEVVLVISAAGAFQFTHQTEQAKDGRPFRIIVDLFPTVHRLGKKSFYDLPPSVVKAVRTSQYSVNPTNTVRIVLDLTAESLYRIEKKNNSVFVYIPDAENKGFAEWSSRARPEPESDTIEPQKQVQEQPALAQTKPEGEDKSKEPARKAAAPVTAQKKDSPEFAYQKPQSSSPIESDLMKPDAGVASPSQKTAPVQATKKTAGKAETATPRKTELATVSKDEPPATEKPASDRATKDAPSAGTASAPGTEKTAPVVAEKPEPQPSSETKKPTSRFRREPDFPAKLKGTIVAEFPKRMVIRYTPGISRDPFASLFNESKKSEGPLEKKIPDVETSRLVGVLESVTGENRALLEDIDGFGFILKPGDKVKKGYLSQVYSDKAIFQLFEYGWSRTIALNLNEEK